MRPLCVQLNQGPPLAALAWGTENTFERVQGWLKRDSVSEGEGLLIRPCSSIHTLGMRFTIDVAFLERDGRVVKLAHRVAPSRLVWGPWPSLLMPWKYQVLELPAGALEASGLQVGQSLGITER